MRSELEEAALFNDEATLRSIRRGITALVDGYGTSRVEQLDGVGAMREQVAAALESIETGRRSDERGRLEGLAGMLADTGETALAQRVRDYLQRHFDN